MAEFIEELIDDLVTEAIITAKGTDGFYDQMPDVTTSPVLAVYDNGGTAAHRSPVLQRSVSFRVRADDYDTARTLARTVFARVHQMIDTTVGTRRVLWALADGIPTSIGRDSANRSLVVFNTTFGTV